MERDRDSHQVERLSQQQVELEDRIDTGLEMLMDLRIPQQERIISKLQQDEQRLEQVSNELKVLQDTTVPTQKQIQNFRDRIVGKLKQGGEKVKTVLHKLLRKVEVEQDGFLEFDFIVVLGKTPSGQCPPCGSLLTIFILGNTRLYRIGFEIRIFEVSG